MINRALSVAICGIFAFLLYFPASAEILPGPLSAETIPEQDASPRLTLTPEKLSFGETLLGGGQIDPLKVSATNTGTAPIQFVNFTIRVEGPDRSSFNLTETPSWGPMAPGEIREYYVRFRPMTPGAHAAMLRFYTNDPTAPISDVILEGVGLESADGSRPYEAIGPGFSTVGPGGTYPDMTAAIADMREADPLTGGDWEFRLVGDVVEPGAVDIDLRDSPHRITIRPDAQHVKWTLGTRSHSGHLSINSSTDDLGRNFTIDGSSVPGGELHNLTVHTNVDSLAYSRAVRVTGNVRDVVIRNVNFTAEPLDLGTTFAWAAVNISGRQLGSRVYGAPENVLVENCHVDYRDVVFGQGFEIITYPPWSTPFDGQTQAARGVVLRGNTVLASGRGIYIDSVEELLVEGNTFAVDRPTGGFSTFGILSTRFSPVPPLDDVSITIIGNRFEMIRNPTNLSTIENSGIVLDGHGNRHKILIANNEIAGLQMSGPGPGALRHAGISISRGIDADVRIYHNSINIAPSDSAYSSLVGSNCFGIGFPNSSFTGNVDIRNNIVRNAQPGGTAIYLASNSESYTINNNVLHAEGSIGRLGAAEHVGLKEWRGASGHDFESVSLDPTAAVDPYVGSWISHMVPGADLHFTEDPGTQFRMPPIPGVSVDIDGETRNAARVLTGSDEVEVLDDDGDGVLDETEDGAPNGGDGNNDSILDRSQHAVASLPTTEGSYITLVASSGMFKRVRRVALTELPNGPPDIAGLDFPHGLLAFDILDLVQGAAVAVEVILPEGSLASSYMKNGPTDDVISGEWYEFDFDGTTGATLGAGSLTLHFIDGARGDGNLTADGVIPDLGGPIIELPPVGGWVLY